MTSRWVGSFFTLSGSVVSGYAAVIWCLGSTSFLGWSFLPVVPQVSRLSGAEADVVDRVCYLLSVGSGMVTLWQPL